MVIYSKRVIDVKMLCYILVELSGVCGLSDEEKKGEFAASTRSRRENLI